MKRCTLAVVVMFVLAVSANAGSVTVSATSAPTAGLDGFSTWTVNATSDSGDINGIDVTFSGAMNQLNPFGLATIFQDMNQALGADVSHDSQFLFKSNTILSTATGEDSSKLTGAITNIANLGGGMSVDFAQIVIADGGSVTYSAKFDDGGGVAAAADGTVGIPEPTALVLISLALVGLAFFRRGK